MIKTIIQLIVHFLSKLHTKPEISPLPTNNTSPDIPDNRDFIVQPELEIEKEKSYIIPNLPPIRSQGKLSSCASHAIIGCYEVMLGDLRYIEGSELFHYFNVRRYINDKWPDNKGMTIRDACKGMQKYGFTPEYIWPYVEEKFNNFPTESAYTLAKSYPTKQYEKLDGLDMIKQSILSNIPVVFGIYVNSDFRKLNKKQFIFDPKKRTTSGHAVCCVGFDDNKKVLIVRNSWGEDWGKEGYFHMTYESFEKTAFDPWRIIIK